MDVGGNGVAVAEGAKVDAGSAGRVDVASIRGAGVHPAINRISPRQAIIQNLE